MDNFDLRDYLQKNKLLKEEKQPVDESIVAVGISAKIAAWLAGGSGAALISYLTYYGKALLNNELINRLGYFLIGSTLYKIPKLFKKIRNNVKAIDEIKESSNVFNKSIRNGTLTSLKKSIEQIVNSKKKSDEEPKFNYPDKAVLKYYKDGVEILEAFDDLQDSIKEVNENLKKVDTKIQKSKESLGKIDQEELKEFEQLREILSSFQLELDKQVSYIDDIRYIVGQLALEIKARKLESKVEKFYVPKQRRLFK